MSIQHTAGPWFVAAQNDGLVIIDGRPSPAPYDGPIPKAHGPNVIATPNFRLPEHEANARLIAEAPKLLEAAHRLLVSADHARIMSRGGVMGAALMNAEEIRREGNEAIEALRDAVDKARGEAR